RVAHEIHIAAGEQDADALAGQVDLLRESGGGGEATGRLDDDLHPASEEAHRIDQLIVSGRDDIGDVLSDDRERVVAETQRLRAIGDGPWRRDGHQLTRAEAPLAVVPRLG